MAVWFIFNPQGLSYDTVTHMFGEFFVSNTPVMVNIKIFDKLTRFFWVNVSQRFENNV